MRKLDAFEGEEGIGGAQREVRRKVLKRAGTLVRTTFCYRGYYNGT